MIFLLHCVWVRVTSHFPVQLVTLLLFMTASSHSRNRWTNSVNLLTWRSDGSIQSNSIFFFLSEATKTLLLLLFSLGVIIAILSLPALLKFSLRKVFSSPHLQSSSICPHHSFTLRSPLAINQQLDSIQNSSHLLPPCLWYSTSILLLAAASVLSFSLSSLSLGYSNILCS